MDVFLKTPFEGGRHQRRVDKTRDLGELELMNAQQRMSRPLAEVDPLVAKAIQNEVERQHSPPGVDLASENFTSEAILEATGSVFTNKYAEGYPGRRYYGRLRVDGRSREPGSGSAPRIV